MDEVRVASEAVDEVIWQPKLYLAEEASLDGFPLLHFYLGLRGLAVIISGSHPEDREFKSHHHLFLLYFLRLFLKLLISFKTTLSIPYVPPKTPKSTP